MVQFRSEQCQGFLEHWRTLRMDGDLVPAQSTFFDQPHPLYAPNLHVAELRKNDLVFRLMGTALVERWGRDKTGEVIGLDQPEAIRSALFNNSKLACAVPCGFRLVIEFAASNGSEMSVEGVVLPLAVDSSRPPRLVSYSAVLQTLKYGDHSERYLGLPTVEWIDIGAGMPKEASHTVARIQ